LYFHLQVELSATQPFYYFRVTMIEKAAGFHILIYMYFIHFQLNDLAKVNVYRSIIGI
jgi:hypothetical protein